MFKGEDLLDGDLSAGRLVQGRNNSAVRAFTETMEDLVIVTWKRAREEMSIRVLRRQRSGRDRWKTYRRGREGGASGPCETL